MRRQSNRFMTIAFALATILMLSNTGAFSSYATPLVHPHPEMPSHVLASQQQIDEQLDLHSDWVGILTWNASSATINYLGPVSNNPYKVDRSHWAHFPVIGNMTKPIAPSTTKTTISPLTITQPINRFQSIYWYKFGGGNSIYKIEQSYPLIASTQPGVDLYHWLDAKNSNTNKWLQVSAMYDKANIYGSSAWYVFFDRWTPSSCTEDSSFPSKVPVGFTTGNTATAFIRADSVTAGRYILEVDSGSFGGSMSMNVSGDTGHNIDIGRTTQYVDGTGCKYPSGAEVEEQSNNGGIYYYGTPTYTYGFYDTSSSSKATSLYSYYINKEGNGGDVTPVTNPAYEQFSCTGVFTCP